ncbi:hypothetical protein [Streptomyces sp. LN785]|uniref:hypothetical protein n=1 Tax=Streptomyces sp. LN785 TaxID=3112983 RepID=UPI0037217216
MADPSTWKYAALAGLVAAVVLDFPDLRRRRYRVLDTTGIVFFASGRPPGGAIGPGPR